MVKVGEKMVEVGEFGGFFLLFWIFFVFLLRGILYLYLILC